MALLRLLLVLCSSLLPVVDSSEVEGLGTGLLLLLCGLMVGDRRA